MAIALSEDNIPAVSPTEPKRKRWTRDELAQLAAAGALEAERYQLVEGELIDRMGKHRPHSLAQQAVLVFLQAAFGPWRVEQEPTIDVASRDNPVNEPCPDLVAYRRPSAEIRDRVRPSDIALIVEVSDTTLGFDLRTKGPLYARAGIPEYWVANLPERQLIVHREPMEGEYRSVLVYSELESVAPLAAPEHALRVGEIFA
jgi:Uma2 family endonuclease